MDPNMMNLANNSAEKNKKKKSGKKLRKGVNDKDGLGITDPTNKRLEISDDRKQAEMVTLPDINLTAQSLPGEESKVDTVSAEHSAEKSATEQSKVVLIENGASNKRKRKKKSRTMANMEDEVENVDPTNKRLENARNDKSSLIAKVDSVPQSLSQKKSEVNIVSTETRTMEKPKVDTISSESPSENSASSKKKRKKLKRRTANTENEVEIADATEKCSKISSTNLEIPSTAHSQSQGEPEGDTVSIESPSEKSASSKKKRKKSKRKTANTKDEVEITEATDKCLKTSSNGKSCVTAEIDTNIVMPSNPHSQSQGQREVDTVSIESLSEKSASSKKKRKKSKSKTANTKDEVEMADATDKCSKISSHGKSCVIAEIDSNLEIPSTAQSLTKGQPDVDMVSTEIPLEERAISKKLGKNMNKKTKKKKEQNIVDLTNKCLEISNSAKSCNKAEMGTILDVNSTPKSLQGQSKVDIVSTEIRTMEQPTVDTVLTEIPVEQSAISKRMRKKLNRMARSKSELDIVDPTNGQSCVIAKMDTNLDINSTAQSLSLKQLEENKAPIQIVLENSANGKKKKRKRNKKKVQTADGSTHQGDTFSKDSCHLTKSSPFTRSKRILLILDLNGLLADIIMPPPKGHKSDINIYSRAIFKRPHYYDFLRFCFETFDVGIWSSRSRKIIVKVVDYLLGGLQQKLLFCWDMVHCTQSTFKTLDNKHKPLVCKELRKLWDKSIPNLPWNKGAYDETNTLLIDDSPYKALLNPMHTAIFPHSYSFKDRNDNALGPGGAIRVYLQNLAKAGNVQKYVEQHPFGQSAINDKDASWDYYSKVLQSLSHPNVPIPNQPRPRPNNVILNGPHSSSSGVQLPQDTIAMDET